MVRPVRFSRLLLVAVAVGALSATGSGCAFPILHADEPEPTRVARSRRGSPAPTAHEDAARDDAAHAYASPRPAQRARGTASPRERYEPARSARGPKARRAANPKLPWPAQKNSFEPGPPTPETCTERLSQLGIAYAPVPPDKAPGVREPLRLHGPVAGVIFEPAGRDATHAIIDCRLVLALHAWAAELRRAGVWRVEHYSIYRPFARVGGKGARSGHASALAIDAARFTLDDGSVLDVLNDWEDRSRGDAPCPMRPDETLGSRILRGVTCAAVDDGLFQVVITPHHDRAHENHVHLEWKPNVDWTYVR